MDYLRIFSIVLPSVFLAGLVDSIAGGGGLISVPAYLASGLPPHFALGNNKFSSSIGTLFATLMYRKSRMIDMKVALFSALFALGGSFLGTRTVLLMNPDFLRYVLVILIPIIAAYTLINKKFGEKDKSHEIPMKRKIGLSVIAGFVIGFYDGFFGPGTGSFLILFNTLFLKYDLATANGNTKVVNLASNIAAVVTFIASGKVIFIIGMPAAIAGVLGNVLGAKIAITKGAKIIRPVFIFALALLMIKILSDII
ncbi:MAG: TSUP family transporter [bacterium]